MKTVAIVKASKISNYFPSRYDVRIAGQGVLDMILGRLRLSKRIDEIVLATSDDPLDDSLAETASRQGVRCCKSDYDDLFGRLKKAASISGADVCVRVSGNYPLVDPYEADSLIEALLSSGKLYGSNEFYGGVATGLGVEVFKKEVFDLVDESSLSASQRKFGTKFFPDILPPGQTLSLGSSFSRPKYRLSLAVPEDVEIISQILKNVRSPFNKDIVEFLDGNPIIARYAEKNISKSFETGLEKLMLYPDKAESLLSSKGGVDGSYPVSVELSLTNRCNLSCAWCSDRGLRERTAGDMDFDAYKKLIDDLASNGTEGVVIEGGGEPTLYSHFREAVDYAKKAGLRLGLISNGCEIPYLEYLESFDWVRISLDASTPEQFKRIKGRDCFDRVVENIYSLSSAKGATVIGVGYVLSSANEERLEELIAKLQRMHVDYLQIRPVIDNPSMSPVNVDIEYLAKHSSGSFKVNVSHMKENVITGNFNCPCLAHSLSSVVAANGDVFICGRLNKYEWLEPLGSLHDSSFNSIWRGERRKRQAERLLQPEFCRKWCPECRLTKYNMLLSNVRQIKTKGFI